MSSVVHCSLAIFANRNANEIIGQIVNFYEKDKEFYRILFEIRIEKANLDVMLRDIKIEIDK